MKRRTITILMALAAMALLAVGATSAPAKQGADDPAGHVRHNGADDGAKTHRKAKKCRRALHHNRAAAAKKKCKKARHARRGARHADDSPRHDAGDDNGGSRPTGTSDDPADHDAGDDNGGDRPAGTSDDPADHDAGDDHGGSGGHGADDA